MKLVTFLALIASAECLVMPSTSRMSQISLMMTANKPSSHSESLWKTGRRLFATAAVLCSPLGLGIPLPSAVNAAEEGPAGAIVVLGASGKTGKASVQLLGEQVFNGITIKRLRCILSFNFLFFFNIDLWLYFCTLRAYLCCQSRVRLQRQGPSLGQACDQASPLTLRTLHRSRPLLWVQRASSTLRLPLPRFYPDQTRPSSLPHAQFLDPNSSFRPLISFWEPSSTLPRPYISTFRVARHRK
jgi:hypothetical protein